ncbi:MAG TPA: response regulator transcription factor [Gaiellaceae bacterium]|nr:response regulator transcription factor [Gaiellaceae bacterium]
MLIVSEIRLYREGLAEMLQGEDGVDVVGTAAGADEAVQLLRANRPEIVLLDMAIPDNAWLVSALVAAEPGTRVVALAVPENEREVLACAEAGVAGYVTREGSVEDLVAAVESVARGETLCSPRMAATLFQRIATLALERSPGSIESRLTSRELQILDLIDQGLSNKEIARLLTIELSTVKNHVHNILEKLQVSRRSEAAARARAERSPVSPARA